MEVIDNLTDALVNATAASTAEHHVLRHSSRGVFVGAGISIGGNVLISIAMNTQRYAHVKNQERKEEDGSGKNYLQNWVWWIGLTLMVLGELGNFSAYSFAPASVVAPLGMTTVLANAAIAVIFLKETLRDEDILGAFMAIIGAFLIINFCGKEEPAVGLTGHVLMSYLKQPALITYLSLELLAIAFLWYIREARNIRSVVLTLILSSLIGSWTVISAKGVAGLLRMTLLGHSQLTHPLLYIMTLILVVTAILQVKFLTEAMITNPATVVVPTNFVFFTVSAIVAGVIFYQEFHGLEFLDILMFSIGCLLCFAGVWFITLTHKIPGASPVGSPDPVQNGSYIAAPPLFGIGSTSQFVLVHGRPDIGKEKVQSLDGD